MNPTSRTRPRRDERRRGRDQKRNPTPWLAIALCVALAGCNEEYRKADDAVLCNPSTGQAFMVHPGGGALSYVQRNARLDALCPTTQPTGQSK